MSSATSRLGLDTPASTDSISGFPADDVEALGVLDNAVIYRVGTVASRPSTGIDGTIYRSTDSNDISFLAGTSWQSLAQATGAGGTLQFLVGNVRVQLGSGTFTFPGSSPQATSLNLYLAGATDIINGVISCGVVSNGDGEVIASLSPYPETTGAALIGCVTRDGSSPAAGSTVSYGYVLFG
jgi:hypothetical protein